jgi:prevent-host-death family protein
MMDIVTIQQAKMHLVELMERVLEGEEIIVAKGKKPIAKIVSIPKSQKQGRLAEPKAL